MSEPVAWSPDGTPHNARFGDIYRSTSGGLAQARHVFLAGCGLPQQWAGQRQWRVLETGFGLGLNFLATWAAWKADPQRPTVLHFASVEAYPVAAEDLLRSAALHPDLEPLARMLAAQWWGLVPGVHRMGFEGGRVLLTLSVGDARAMLAEQAFSADSVFLDGFDPQRNPAMWDLPLLKAVARLCRRGTTMATWTVAGAVRRELQQCGFVLDKVTGLPPKRECLRGRFDPAWELRRAERPAVEPSRAVVVGGGLAGAAAASSLARRGWQVDVLDAAHQPASGASALPAGLLAPHVSPDDNLLARLSRSGVRITLQEAALRLRAGEDWAHSGVLRRRGADERAPADLGPWGDAWQRWPGGSPRELWHPAAAWIKPGRLVQAWLTGDGIRWRGGVRVHGLERSGGQWQLLDADGLQIAQAPLVVVAASLGSAALLPDLAALHPVRGQVSWDLLGDGEPLAGAPVNGNGHLLPQVPLEAGTCWLSGSTYGRGDADAAPRAEDQQANLARLRALLPAAADRLAPAFAAGTVRAWSGVRCASADRRPLVGDVAPGLWVSTAMGSRGLTFAALCAELLAARLHAEPLPLPVRLAAALDARRHAGVTPSRAAP
ncbi:MULTISPECIES: tRNA (5-methylaminomethyl-2-thiouridine)(34)-methyltransferase MnmD [Ramlibacter]|uniref:tRNA 5-methylaminomethyl-2-thiouridine biosynthesis bifunctional protein MnmC n=1 Tax=Ramlibacter pinisoli TaxID=2682844 RepID=A0A6N8IYQ2_9BURK|nr:tRNA (5-methylaminomethyl-2-thiouridine)(34)-methyltransferase MnmD [Ramlibacter sp. CGMCC 1.13660]MVQ31123.1 tRNA (5-methylaminomethyl-2-thiouridine)(34)-methyltransferase MnmD [Ramlibacter pinisoli]